MQARQSDQTIDLLTAIRQGDTDRVNKIISDKHSNINSRDKHGKSALMVASAIGDVSMVRLLLTQVDLEDNHCDEGNTSALICASQGGHREVVKMLLENGAQVDLQDGKGWSALMHASRDGHCEVVKLLLEKKQIAVHKGNDAWLTSLLWT